MSSSLPIPETFVLTSPHGNIVGIAKGGHSMKEGDVFMHAAHPDCTVGPICVVGFERSDNQTLVGHPFAIDHTVNRSVTHRLNIGRRNFCAFEEFAGYWFGRVNAEGIFTPYTDITE